MSVNLIQELRKDVITQSFLFYSAGKKKGAFAEYDTQSSKGNSKIGERKIQ